MSKHYELADKGAVELLERVRKEHHEVLGNDLRIEFLFHVHEKANDERVPMRVAGYATAGRVKILGPVDRAAGRPDLQLVVCWTWWQDAEHPERAALLDRLLTYVERIGDEEDLDEYERPKLKKRRADYRIEGFAEVAERHGEHALEVRQLERFAHSPQLWLPGLKVQQQKPRAA